MGGETDEVSASPIRVLVADCELESPILRADRGDGKRWAGAWLIARAGGEAAGIVEIPFDGRDEIPAEEVRGRLAEVVADAPPRGLADVPDERLPRASVVVATDLRRPEQLRGCVSALLALDYPGHEVIVVDNHRDPALDGRAEDVLDGLSGVRLVREPTRGVSAARNAGARAAAGEIVAFTDDDVVVDRGWLRALGARYALRPDEDMVTGLIVPADLETHAQLWFERHYGGFGGVRGFEPLTYRGTGASGGPARRARVAVHDWSGRELRRFAVYGAGICGAGANMSFRAETLRRLGGFDLSLGPGTPARGGEDLVLFIALLWNGGSIGYEPAAIVSHSHRSDYEGLRKQLHDYGLGFTALLSALIWQDPRHVLGILSQVPAYLRQRRRGSGPTAETITAGHLGPPPPPELAGLEGRGAFKGPAAWLHSKLTERRRTRPQDRGASRSTTDAA